MMPQARSGWAATDEGPHGSSGDGWCEIWGFAGTDGAGTGVLTTFGVVPSAGRAWYVAALVRPGHGVAYVGDDEIVRRTDRLSVRRPGLWADHTCEEPFEQWTVANEAYAVELDEPDDALGDSLGDARGTTTALAFDLEWYAAGSAEPAWPDGEAARFGYQQRGEIDGVVEVPGGPITCSGPAHRVHLWGDIATLPDALGAAVSTSTGAFATDERGVVIPVGWPLPGGVLVVEHHLTPAGWRTGPRRGAS